MDLHKSIYGAQWLEFSSSITQIELWIIINRIMGVHKSFIELRNSIIIRNLDNPAMEFLDSIMENHN